ncbi:hypothetical protein D3C75_1315070 [compost metagenome]
MDLHRSGVQGAAQLRRCRQESTGDAGAVYDLELQQQVVRVVDVGERSCRRSQDRRILAGDRQDGRNPGGGKL